MATIEVRKGKRRIKQADGNERVVERTAYRARIRIGDVETSRTFKRRSDAKAWAAAQESKVRTDGLADSSKAMKLTVRDLIAEWKSHEAGKLTVNDRRTRAGQLAWWETRIGPRKALALLPMQISEELTQLARQPSKRTGRPPTPRTVESYYRTLARVFAWAYKGDLLPRNPMEKVRAPRVRNARTRFLSDKETDALLNVCRQSADPDLYLIVLLALTTGARKSEIMGLRWGDFDSKAARLTLRDTKNGETRSVGVPGEALDLLKTRREPARFRRDFEAELVFPAPNAPMQPRDFRKAWETARAEAKLGDFRFHDLRHTAASWLAMNGASLLEIATILGHKTLAMVRRYAHLTQEHQADVQSRMVAAKLKGGAT